MSVSSEPTLLPPPPAKDCDSIYSLSSLTFETPYPCDLYNESKKAKPPPASFYERLRELRDTDRIFVKPASRSIIRYIDEKCQFEVLNKAGEPIFFALDVTDAWASTVFEGTKPFHVMILNYDYAEVLKISGSGLSRVHGNAWVKHCGKVVGRIAQDDHLCSFSPTYSIEGVNGVTGLKIKGPPNSYAVGLPENPSFDVLLLDEVSVMGRITKQWTLFGKLSEDATPEEAYIVNFHPNMDLRTKCSILSIVFMLDYQYYHKTVQGGVSRKVWIWFTIFFFSLVIFILVAVDVIKEYQIAALNSTDDLNATSSTTTTTPQLQASNDLGEYDS